MADDSNKFISADLSVLANFKTDSEEVAKKFETLKTRFSEINSALLLTWTGEGADEYKKETDHILENIGGIGDAFKAFSDGPVEDVLVSYNALDEELAAFNEDPQATQKAQG